MVNSGFLSTLSRENIEVVISSPGGSLYDALAIYDVIRQLDVPVTTKAYGRAMSAATLVLIAGDKRIITPYTQIMVHPGSGNLEGNPEELNAGARHVKHIQNKF